MTQADRDSADRPTVLIVDADTKRAADLAAVLASLGAQTLIETEASSEAPPGLVLLGETQTALPALADSLSRRWPGVPVAVVGETAERPANAIDCVRFPCSYWTLLDLLHRAEAYRRQYAANHRRSVGRTPEYTDLAGRSPAIEKVRDMMARVADKDITVLITGPSGSGKEVVARNLHRHSRRAGAPFVPVNCGAIPRELLESELFGHEKGAFTGAISSRPGRFEMAQGGTLFLDEIGDMPLDMQVKILRVLQERQFERVGSSTPREADVRIIAATHKNLEVMMEAGDFREDLYYRLNVFPLEMPPLSERHDDIPLLIGALVRQMEDEQRGSVRFDTAAMAALRRYDWPGNIRELANLVERMAILHPGAVVGVNELPDRFRHGIAVDEEPDAGDPVAPDMFRLPEGGIDLKETVAALELALIEQALAQTGGVVARAAEKLGIQRTTLVEKMRKYGLHNPRGRATARG